MQLRQLTIENFRSIEYLTWCPRPGVNCLIGPGDSGKTSILDAIALLLAPYAIDSANELDYRNRNLRDGFRVEAVITGFADEPLIQQRRIPPLRGWKDGTLRPLPDEEGAEPALVCEVSANANLDLTYSVLPLDGDPVPFSVGLRRDFSLARISATDRANRDLRLGSGSLLTRYFQGPNLGSGLTEAVRAASDRLETPEAMEQRFVDLKKAFKEVGLPETLQFGVLPAVGWSLNGMVALATGSSPSTAIPIANAGVGTRNLSLLELSVAMSAENPIIVIDEPERGLEPYRQRHVGARLSKLIGANGQAFMTTHAPALLGTLGSQSVWHMPDSGKISRVDEIRLGRVLNRHPDAFFARVPILCEGATEVGLLKAWLRSRIGPDLSAKGIELVDGEGQPHVLAKLSALAEAGIPCAAFLDQEDTHDGRRRAVTHQVPCFCWMEETNIEDALSRHLSLEQLIALIEFAGELNNISVSNYGAQIRETLRRALPEVESVSINELVLQAGEGPWRTALGSVMSDKNWFKTEEKGERLGEYLQAQGLPEAIDSQIDAFVELLKTRFDI